MTPRPRPRAILFDLDDTILSAYGRPALAWRTVAAEFADRLKPHPPDRIADAISTFARDFWADPVRHKAWRNRIPEARREIVAGALERLRAADTTGPADALGIEMAERFTAFRDAEMRLFPDALATLDALRQAGLRLALVTNGGTAAQRAKVERFDLARRFDHIQIEEEAGFGKPEERAYRHAMAVLGVAPHETWMIGDHIEWDVAAPQRLGITAVWYDPDGKGLPGDADARPHRVVRSLAEFRDGLLRGVSPDGR